MSEMMVLDSTGDTRIQWNKTNPDEVDAAEERFDQLRSEGYAAFRVNKKGDQGESITEFDPHAERLILVPPIVGG